MTTPFLPRLTTNHRIAFYEGNIVMNNRLGSKAECCIWKNRHPSTTPRQQGHGNAFPDAIMSRPLDICSSSKCSSIDKPCSTNTMTTATASTLAVQSAHPNACIAASSPKSLKHHRRQALPWQVSSSCSSKGNDGCDEDDNDDDWSPSTTHVDAAMDDHVCRKSRQLPDIPPVIFITSQRSQQKRQQRAHVVQPHHDGSLGSRQRTTRNDGRGATSEQAGRRGGGNVNVDKTGNGNADNHGDDDDTDNDASHNSNDVPTLHAYFHGAVVQQKRNLSENDLLQEDSLSTLATSSIDSLC
jgi:hypothetical protein